MSGHLQRQETNGSLMRHDSVTYSLSARYLRFMPTNRVGFEQIPVDLRRALLGSGLLVGEEFAATMDRPPIVKRRTDGSYYQAISAWWSSPLRYVEIEIQRELVATHGGRLRTNGRWSATAEVFLFPYGLQPYRSEWDFVTDDQSGDWRQRNDSQPTRDPLDTLPAQVVGPVRGGKSDAWRVIDSGVHALETIVAVRTHKEVDNPDLISRIALLRARREARFEDDLWQARWFIETLDGLVVDRLRWVLGDPEPLFSTAAPSLRNP